MNLVPNKQLLLYVPFQSTKYRKKELCEDNKVQETNGDVFCPTFRNQKSVYVSTKKTTSFYDYKKCKACCHVLNFPFKDQKPTIILFGGDGTHCFARKTSRDYEKKASRFLKKFLRQSQPSTPKTEPKRVVKIFFFQIIFFNINLLSTSQIYSTYIQLTENHDLLSLQRWIPVDSWFRSPFYYYCCKWSRPKYNNQLTRNTPSCQAIADVSKARFFG